MSTHAAPSTSAKDLLVALGYAVSWSIVSSGLILLNKYILSTLDFHYPLTLSSLGMGFSSLASAVLIHVFKTHRLEHKMSRDFYIRRVLPMGFFMAATLGFGNLAYLYLSVSFIQILKAATPVMTMIVLVAARLDKPSTPVTVAVSIIAVGTAVASWGELAFSLLGFIIMVTSEFCEALKLAAMQYMLGNLKLNLMEGIYYLTPAGFLWMCFFILPLELSRMADEGAAAIVFANMPAFVLAATMGFFVNLLSYGVIQSTSSLTFKVLGQVKNVAVVVASCVIFGSRVSGLQAVGYALAIIGFALYNKAKAGAPPPAGTTGIPSAVVPAGLSDKNELQPVPLVSLAGSATNLVELGDSATPGSARFSVMQRANAANAHGRQGSLGGDEPSKAGEP